MNGSIAKYTQIKRTQRHSRLRFLLNVTEASAAVLDSFFMNGLQSVPLLFCAVRKSVSKSCYCFPLTAVPHGRTCLLNAKFIGTARFFFTQDTKPEEQLGSRGVCDLSAKNRRGSTTFTHIMYSAQGERKAQQIILFLTRSEQR